MIHKAERDNLVLSKRVVVMSTARLEALKPGSLALKARAEPRPWALRRLWRAFSACGYDSQPSLASLSESVITQ